MSQNIEQKCLAKGVKLTDQRKIIAKVILDKQFEPILPKLYAKQILS